MSETKFHTHTVRIKLRVESINYSVNTEKTGKTIYAPPPQSQALT
jgi:hypothetical protein